MADGHGGPRQGRPGVAYGQRTDLNRDPMKTAPTTRAPRPAAESPTAAAGGGPGVIVRFDAPTQRPNEPVTAGAPIGPGPGLEALGPIDPRAQDLEALRPYLPALEFMASQPNSTPSLRNFVRTVRGSVPYRPAG